jgi:hypothetical protein
MLNIRIPIWFYASGFILGQVIEEQHVLTSMVYIAMAIDLPPWAIKAIPWAIKAIDRLRRGFFVRGRKRPKVAIV